VLKACADSLGSELCVGSVRSTFPIDRKIALLDTVLRKDALLDPARAFPQRRDEVI
jgi:hypothetical protein